MLFFSETLTCAARALGTPPRLEVCCFLAELLRTSDSEPPPAPTIRMRSTVPPPEAATSVPVSASAVCALFERACICSPRRRGYPWRVFVLSAFVCPSVLPLPGETRANEGAQGVDPRLRHDGSNGKPPPRPAPPPAVHPVCIAVVISASRVCGVRLFHVFRVFLLRCVVDTHRQGRSDRRPRGLGRMKVKH